MPFAAALLLCSAWTPAWAEDPTPPPAPPAPSATRYRVGPGDVVQVQVYGETALTGPFPVNDAGALDFPLLGSVAVQGLTGNEIADLLRARLGAGYINEPTVTAWLSGYKSQPVQVLGAVAKPGQYYLHGTTTVLQILGEAGGVNRGGANEIRITRGSETEDVTVVPYELLVSQGKGNLTLEGGDVVFVPESLVSVMGQVAKPGDVAYRDDLTVSTCIAAAGGALPTANLGRVFILRDGQRTRVNIRKVVSGKVDDPDVESGDRIFVGESAF